MLGGWFWIGQYGITEWLINYQAGFIRRGLPGELIYHLLIFTGWQVVWLIFAICLALYGIYVFFILTFSRFRFPRWALWTSPLLGYPFYSSELIRKDVFLLVLLIILLKLILALPVSFLRQSLISLLACLTILSHELFLFVALPICMLIDFSLLKTNGDSYSMRYRAISMLAAWSLPIITGTMVIISNGTIDQALEILKSWRELVPIQDQSNILRYGLPGPLSWLGKTLGYGYLMTRIYLLSSPIGIPVWLMVIAFLLLAAMIIMCLFFHDSDRLSFSFYFVLQSLFLLPIYFFATDQGRWIFLHLNSAFVFTLMHPLSFSEAKFKFLQQSLVNLKSRIPLFVCVFVLTFWGFPALGTWSLQRWLQCTPFYAAYHAPLEVYHQLRINKLIPRLL